MRAERWQFAANTDGSSPLGSDDGDFAATNFSTNLQSLLAAALSQ